MIRDITSSVSIEEAFDEFGQMLDQRLAEKGEGLFVSAHESLGVVEEEHIELIEAVKENNEDKIAKELLDVAIAAFWGYVSIKNKPHD